MITEAIVSTVGDSGVNFAPMGCRIFNNEAEFQPFCQTMTYENLLKKPFGVINITSQVEVFVDTALKTGSPPYNNSPYGGILKSCTKYYLFSIKKLENSKIRAKITVDLLESFTGEECWEGLNRAQFAILESTIIATRLHLLSTSTVMNNIQEYNKIVAKTGSRKDLQTMQKVLQYISGKLEG